MVRPNSNPGRYIQATATAHSAKKTSISIRYGPGLGCSYNYIQVGAGGRKKTALQCNEGDSERDESTEEQLQCNKAVFIHSSRDTIPCFLFAMARPVYRIRASKQQQHRNKSCENAISEITNPKSYCGDPVKAKAPWALDLHLT